MRQVVQLDLLPAPPPRHLKPHSELAPRRRPTANPGWARASAPACSASRCELAAEAGVAALACVCVCGVATEARVTATPITPPRPPLLLRRAAVAVAAVAAVAAATDRIWRGRRLEEDRRRDPKSLYRSYPPPPLRERGSGGTPNSIPIVRFGVELGIIGVGLGLGLG